MRHAQDAGKDVGGDVEEEDEAEAEAEAVAEEGEEKGGGSGQPKALHRSMAPRSFRATFATLKSSLWYTGT